MNASLETKDVTRHRLLDAAGEVFAEKGYRSATVREICRSARANVASVNYHFGDKLELYRAVLKLAHQCSCEKYPPDFGLGPHPGPEERIHAFVRSFLLRIFDKGQPAWFGKLMSREILEPTAALDTLVSEEIQPKFSLLESIVSEISGSNPAGRGRRRGTLDSVRLAALSVVGQCLFYFHSRSILERLSPEDYGSPRVVEQLADHIARFSLAAIRGLVPSSKRKTAERKRKS